MTGRFTVLASGSSGNAALLETTNFGLLIDCGLPPRMLTHRLREVGHPGKRSTPSSSPILMAITGKISHSLIYEAARFHFTLTRHNLNSSACRLRRSRRFIARGLTRTYRDDRLLELATGLIVQPVRVSHDAEPTFAFRIDRTDSDGLAWAIGYASDLGCGSPELIDAFAGVDVLALEFNHDVKLERASRRPQFLVDRVLSDCGHLSNAQAAELAAAIAERSGDGFPGHLVQLHLSRECNRPTLASAVGHAALARYNPRAEVVTAQQNCVAKSISLTRRHNSANRLDARKQSLVRATVQPQLPGFDG